VSFLDLPKGGTAGAYEGPSQGRHCRNRGPGQEFLAGPAAFCRPSERTWQSQGRGPAPTVCVRTQAA